MSRPLLSCLAAFGVALMPLGVHAQPPLTLKTPPSVDLPFGDAAFPPGPGLDAINNNCLTCHSADHVLNQPMLSKESWEEVVAKMVRAYKAPISKDDQEKIVDYLAHTKGKA